MSAFPILSARFLLRINDRCSKQEKKRGGNIKLECKTRVDDADGSVSSVAMFQ